MPRNTGKLEHRSTVCTARPAVGMAVAAGPQEEDVFAPMPRARHRPITSPMGSARATAPD